MGTPEESPYIQPPMQGQRNHTGQSKHQKPYPDKEHRTNDKESADDSGQRKNKMHNKQITQHEYRTGATTIKLERPVPPEQGDARNDTWTSEHTHTQGGIHNHKKMPLMETGKTSKSWREKQRNTPIVEKWAHKTSKHELTPTERRTLSTGLNLAITTKNIPHEEFILANELACEKIPDQGQKSSCILKTARPPPSNIIEKEAIKATAKKQGRHNSPSWIVK